MLTNDALDQLIICNAASQLTPHITENTMDFDKESHALSDKLAVPMTRIVDKHRGRITAILASDGASHLGNALSKDENVRKVATFCYPLLPGLLRLVVKEHRFIQFVMLNREKLLARLAPPAAPGHAA
jgi:hypothetical protein